MPNDLHSFLHKAAVQARPTIGSPFSYPGYGSPLTGFISSTDAKLAFQLTGSMEEIGLVIVADLDQFTGDQPMLDDQISYGGVTWALRSLGSDESAYVMGFKSLTNTP
jgi:hypothetical protein